MIRTLWFENRVLDRDDTENQIQSSTCMIHVQANLGGCPILIQWEEDGRLLIPADEDGKEWLSLDTDDVEDFRRLARTLLRVANTVEENQAKVMGFSKPSPV